MSEVVELNILGQSFMVKSPEGKDAVESVVSSLEEKIEEVKEATSTADTMRILLYTAFKVAEENIKLANKLSSLEEEVESTSSRILEMIDIK